MSQRCVDGVYLVHPKTKRFWVTQINDCSSFSVSGDHPLYKYGMPRFHYMEAKQPVKKLINKKLKEGYEFTQRVWIDLDQKLVFTVDPSKA